MAGSTDTAANRPQTGWGLLGSVFKFALKAAIGVAVLFGVALTVFAILGSFGIGAGAMPILTAFANSGVGQALINFGHTVANSGVGQFVGKSILEPIGSAFGIVNTPAAMAVGGATIAGGVVATGVVAKKGYDYSTDKDRQIANAKTEIAEKSKTNELESLKTQSKLNDLNPEKRKAIEAQVEACRKELEEAAKDPNKLSAALDKHKAAVDLQNKHLAPKNAAPSR